jgi:hypothetical protein
LLRVKLCSRRAGTSRSITVNGCFTRRRMGCESHAMPRQVGSSRICS